jgi:uncharacterized phage-associated protein
MDNHVKIIDRTKIEFEKLFEKLSTVQDNKVIQYDSKDIDSSISNKVKDILVEVNSINTQDSSNGINVFDVASYILKSLGKMSTMKLQKLVYYCQAWSLVWDEKPLFQEKIKAWTNGPVIGELFFQLKGLFLVEEDDLVLGNYGKLNPQQINTIDAVLKYYGDRSSQWLIELSHMEDPWIEARKGLQMGEKSNRIIELDTLARYYSSL